MNWLPKTIKTLLFTTVLTPLVVTPSVVFPYIFGKITLFRGLTLLSFCLTLVWFGLEVWRSSDFFSNYVSKLTTFLKSFFGIIFSLTTASFLISAFLATDQFIAFWGDVERGEGVFGIFTIGLFLLLSYFWFNQLDWKKFWWGTWGVGVIISLYSWLEYLGIFGITQVARPGSLFGNAGMFSTYIILLLMVPVILWTEAKEKIKYLLLGSEILFLSAILLSGTRGAFLGLVAGIIFLAIWQAIKGGEEVWFWKKSKSFWARIVLGILIIFAVVFGFTRSSDVWTKVPLLNRLALSAVSNIKDPSTATRLITWDIAWEAFKERPVFGWGPDHFITAYERHYDPEFATYGETWIDRAHNQFLDMLVSRGVIGLGLWLVLLVSLFLLPPKDFSGKRIWWGILTAYIVQSIFIFDSILSYLVLTSFIAFWLSKKEEVGNSLKNINKNFSYIFGLLAVGVLVFVYFSVYLPIAQARQYREASKNPDVQKVVEELRASSKPFTLVQPNLRIKTVDTFYLDEFFYRDEYRNNPKFKILGDTIVENLKEVVEKHGKYDIRYAIQLVEVLNAYAREDKNIYLETEKILRDTLLLSPNRLELYYHLAFSLTGQDRTAEAVGVARRGLALNPRAPRSHFSLGLMLAADRQDAESQAQFAELEKIDPGFNNLLPSDKKTLGMLYSAWQMYDKVGGLVLKSLKGVGGFGVGVLNRETYENGLRYFASKEMTEEFLLTADYLKNFSDLKEDMETLIDLVKNGNWAIIHSLK
jgi:O-antigen ligase/tetratricopeptide (TPR) repeat protein